MDNNSPINTENLTSRVVMCIVAVIILALVLVPLINGFTQTVIDVDEVNTGYSGVDLGYYDKLDSSVYSSTVEVELSDDNIVFTGDYEKTVPVENMILLISDTGSIWVQDGSIYIFNGSNVSTATNVSLTIDNDEVMGVQSTWAYFPTTDGEYASFPNGYEYRISDAVSTGSFAGVSVISVNEDKVLSTYDNINVHVQKTDKGVSGVTYGA